MIVSDRDCWTEAQGHPVDKSDTGRHAAAYRVRMRWEALFADLESQLDAVQARDRLADLPDLTRAERAGVTLADRLRGHGSAELGVALLDGETLQGRVADVGPQWLLLAEGPREHLVPLRALAGVTGLARAAAPPPGVAMSRLTLGHALRAIARDRAVVRLRTTAGEVIARVDAVGGDHLDAAAVQPDSGRPTGELRAVPWSALLLVSRL